jgi:hypothetical protein
MTRILLFGSAAVSSILLVVGFLPTGYFSYGLVFLCVDILWIVGLLRRWDWVSTLGVCIAFGGAAWGMYLGVAPAFLITAALFSLIAWDLEHFAARLRLAAAEDDTDRLEHQHLMRLAFMVVIGGGLSFGAMAVHVKIPFELTVVLVILMVWGIGRVVSWLLKKE